MRITEISTVAHSNASVTKKKVENRPYVSFDKSVKSDAFSFSGVQADNIIKFRDAGKTMHVVSFTGLNDPTPIAIQFKVRGVTKFQQDYVQALEAKTGGSESTGRSDKSKQYGGGRPQRGKKGQRTNNNNADNGPKSINRLADSNWEDGKQLKFAFDKTRGQLQIVDPNYGPIGYIPEEVAIKLDELGADFKAEDRRDKNFRIELSNLVAGTTKGAKTTGVRVNLIYKGDQKSPLGQKVDGVFNDVLNDKEASDLVFLYQQKVTPEKVLEKIFDNDKVRGNAAAIEEAKKAIDNIVNVIDDPSNKNILLIGHCKPDGDTLGCILGMKNAIDYKYTDKNVDCAVDDKVPGLFRSKLPGVDDIVKRPFSKNKIAKMSNTIEDLRTNDSSANAQDKIEILEDEKESLSQPQNLINPNKKYDVVIMMDVPTPKRFTDEFKNQIEGAKKVIYIDHHPHRFNEWQESKAETGVDMAKIHNNGLAWVADAVPAATEQVAIIAKKLIPELGEEKYSDLSQDKKDKLDAFVASTVVGMSTDTGAFTRTANLLPEHMSLPVQQRPNFMPEGLSKWLMGLSEKVNKKWLREEITYDIPDEKIPELDKTSRDIMVGYAESGQKISPELSLGVMEVDYDQMFDVWKSARKSDKLLNKKDKTEFLDIQNAFKYSDEMGRLKSDPNKRPVDKKDYQGEYDNDRIAILICQDKKAGELDEKFNIATQNGLRLSLRSSGCSDHAELISNLFGGGGHGGASGGRVDLPGVEIDSKLAVKINGKVVSDPKAIYKTLRHNVDVRNDNNLSDAEKLAQSDVIELQIDDSGRTCTELIQAVTGEIRSAGDMEVVNSNKKGGRPSFRGLSLFERKVS